MDEIRMRSARIIGRSHLVSGKSPGFPQNGHCRGERASVYYGVIRDGCSEGRIVRLAPVWHQPSWQATMVLTVQDRF